MEERNEEKLFLARFQSLKFDKNLESGTPSEKADILRNIIVHLSSAPHHKIVSNVTSNKIKEGYVNKYQSIVDCFDESKGLNNFAAGALALCTGKKNESQLWKSSLDVNILEKEPYFQEYLERCKPKSSLKYNSQPLFRPRKKKLVPDAIVFNQELEKPKHALPLYFTGAGRDTQVSNPTPPSSHHPDINPNATISSNSTGPSPFNVSTNSKGQISNSTGPSLFNVSTNSKGQISNSTANNASYKSYININNGISNPGQASFNSNVGQRNVIPSRNQNFDPENTGNNNFQNQITSRQNPVSVYGNPTNTGRGGYTEDQFGSRPSQYQQKKSLFSENSRSSYKENYVGSWNQRQKEWKKRQRVEMEEDEEEEDEMQQKPPPGPFKTARDQLGIDQSKKYGGSNRGQPQGQISNTAYGGVKKSLGTRRGPSSKFVPPVINRDEDGCMIKPDNKAGTDDTEEPVDERLKGIDPKMIELINNEIMDHGPRITWDDVAGLEFAKKTIKEIVVWPMLRPDIFTGLRGPPKGLLLFGPPGTGKTLIGKCIASQSKSTFFCISASSLTSKWVGEGEKMVRALFSVARCNQPAVIFIDEIDSLLSQRSDNEHEASRRIKTEFLVQLDGAATDSEDKILIIGATNRPQEIDEAARRRFVKRLYIPLPENIARRQIIVNLLKQQNHQLTDSDLDLICQKSDGYSGSDMANLCREAALGPIRSIPFDQIETITNEEVRAINLEDFLESLTQVRASVSSKDLDLYIEWNKLYGSFGK